MPIYEDDMDDGTMRLKAKWCVCGECGSPLAVVWMDAYGYAGYILVCTKNINHNGLEAKPTLTLQQILSRIDDKQRTIFMNKIQRHQRQPETVQQQGADIKVIA